jgi:hypothetical protein
MSGFSDEEFASLSLTFTAQTSAAQVQVTNAAYLSV